MKCVRLRGPFWAAVVLMTVVVGGVWSLGGNDADVIRIGNPALRIGFERGTGEWIEFVDRAGLRNLSGSPGAGGGLWKLEFTGSPSLSVFPRNAGACQIQRLPGPEPGLLIRWIHFGGRTPPDLRVEVEVRLDRSRAESRWQIAVEGVGTRTLDKIRFPRVIGIPELGDDRLVMPSWGGLLSSRPRRMLSGESRKEVRHEFDYPGRCSMQCMAYYAEGGAGLYASCDDKAGFRKAFAAFGAPGAGPSLELIHLPEQVATNSARYQLPYSAILGTFRGNWYEAAAIYRGWATNQSWARESRWRRGVVPAWIAETGLWVWNRGRSPNVLGPAVALQREAAMPVSVFWHWWHGCAYDTGFPDYLPPREGSAPFASALAEAHRHDVRALVYMNQRLWGTSTASWTNEHAEVHAVKGADGKVKPEIYNTFTKLPCATMCLATPFWRAKYAGLATEAIRDLGVDGIYMDQACTSLSCHDPAHGHPPGGGTYWMKGFRALESDIRRRTSTRGQVALAGEGCAENWLPHLDALLALDVSRDRFAAPDGWEAVPFFHSVYHGYGVFYGNYSSLTMPPYDDLWPAEKAPKEPLKLLEAKFCRQFRLEQARSFIWGQQPTLANFRESQLRERPDEIDFVLRLARTRRGVLKHLQDGTMLAPPIVKAPTARIAISRLSIYAGQQGAPREFRKITPSVLASVWQAADGTVGIAVANVADEPVRPRILLEAARHRLPPRGRLFRLVDGEPRAVRSMRGRTFELAPELGPRDVQFYEARPE